MLPPKVPNLPNPKFTHPLKLKVVRIGYGCIGYAGLMTNIIKTHPMERIELECSGEFISNEKFSEFFASLPQTGSQLKCLVLPLKCLGNAGCSWLNKESLEYIVKSCVNLEELHLGSCILDQYDQSFKNCVSNNLTPSILKLRLDKNYIDDDAVCKLVKRCSKLQTLDISYTEITWYGLNAIIDNLHCLEYLALPEEIGEELFLGNKIDMVKMERLKKMKQLKCLLMEDSATGAPIYQEILTKEMPQLIRSTWDDFLIAAIIDDARQKQVEFLPQKYRHWWSSFWLNMMNIFQLLQ